MISYGSEFLTEVNGFLWQPLIRSDPMSEKESEDGGIHGVYIRPRLEAFEPYKWTRKAETVDIMTTGAEQITQMIDYPAQGSGAGERIGRIIYCYAITVAYSITWLATTKQEARPTRVSVWADTAAAIFAPGFEPTLSDYTGLPTSAILARRVLFPPVDHNLTDHVTCAHDSLYAFEHRAGILSTKYPSRERVGYINFDFREAPIELLFDESTLDVPVGISFHIGAWAADVTDSTGELRYSTSFFYTEPRTGPKRPRAFDRATTQPWDY